MTEWDVVSAVYEDKSKSVVTETNRPFGLFFNPDGTKMYVMGYIENTVFQYTLSIPWDVSTASYDSKSKDVDSEESSPAGLFFKPDGTKMYVVGTNGDAVFQYSLSVAWDVSTAAYEGKSKDVSSEDDLPFGLFFNPNGSKFYVMGYDGDTIYQYSMSTPWDVSTASYDSKYKSVGSEDGTPFCFFLKPDGTKLYLVGNATARIYQYTLSTPWYIYKLVYQLNQLSKSSYHQLLYQQDRHSHNLP
ncbi:unnamed protein product, partial [marine sediment metagenome]